MMAVVCAIASRMVVQDTTQTQAARREQIVLRFPFLSEWLSVLPFLHIDILYTYLFHDTLLDARILSTV